MKTRFQISIQPKPSLVCSSPKLEGSGPGPLKMWISLHGPHGPVSPMRQKFSSMPMPSTRSSPKPVTFFHRSRAVSSAGTPFSPPK